MRRVLISLASAGLFAATASSATAFDRLPPPDSGSLVTTVADLDAPRSAYRPYRADVYWHWRYRAAYVRWMHNEYVRAGYPVRHRQFRTYARVYKCCYYHRRW